MMNEMELTLACVPTDRSRPILDGTIRIPGVRVKPVPGEPVDVEPRGWPDRKASRSPGTLPSLDPQPDRIGAAVSLVGQDDRTLRHPADTYRLAWLG
jgi:hypothetical protein